MGVDKLRVGDLVVVGRSFLDLNLIARETYEIKAIYYQRIGYDAKLGAVKRATYGGSSRINVDCLGAPLPSRVLRTRNASASSSGWLLWVELYNKRYHDEPVAVQPRAVALTTVWSEIRTGIGIAYPLWLVLV